VQFLGCNYIKPFIKWAGGKSQLLEQYEKIFPFELKAGIIKNYYEPFLGEGDVSFILCKSMLSKMLFYLDINEEFILVYKYSDNWIPRAEQMIFLTKTCFNELFRTVADNTQIDTLAVQTMLSHDPKNKLLQAH